MGMDPFGMGIAPVFPKCCRVLGRPEITPGFGSILVMDIKALPLVRRLGISWRICLREAKFYRFPYWGGS